jgi:hypothetical protein
MTEATVPDQAASVARLGTAAAWISATCCLPYLVLTVLLAFQNPHRSRPLRRATGRCG